MLISGEDHEADCGIALRNGDMFAIQTMYALLMEFIESSPALVTRQMARRHLEADFNVKLSDPPFADKTWKDKIVPPTADEEQYLTLSMNTPMFIPQADGRVVLDNGSSMSIPVSCGAMHCVLH